MRSSRRRKWVIPDIEPLGDRILLACLTSFSGGFLTVACNADNDAIFMKSDTSGRIYLNGIAIPGNPTVTNTSQISVAGGAGGDTINLSGIANWNGRATLVGGTGHDRITDAPGRSDSLYGGNENDTLTGGFGNDTLNGGAGFDLLFESFNTDFKLWNGTLRGVGSDILSSIDSAWLTGGAGNNNLYAYPFLGPVTLVGGAGNDKMTGGHSGDYLDGQDGNDILDWGTLAGGFHRFFGGNGNDLLLGSQSGDRMDGGAGHDTLVGNDGADILIGGSGNDFIDGDEGRDSLTGNDGDDSLNGDDGDDSLNGGSGRDTVRGLGVNPTLTNTSLSFDASENDLLSGFEVAHLLILEATGPNRADASGFSGNAIIAPPIPFSGGVTIIGGAGNDSLVGSDGNDSIVGGAGNDTLDGGAGNDTGIGGAGIDVFLAMENETQ